MIGLNVKKKPNYLQLEGFLSKLLLAGSTSASVVKSEFINVTIVTVSVATSW